MRHPTSTIEEVKRQSRLKDLEEGNTGTMDSYQITAAQFRNRMQINDAQSQYLALVEEVGELAEALNRGEDTAEEIADILVTAFVLADIEEVDISEEYDEKMRYNLEKSGRKQGGKVVDDG